jgi:hippurate hydrolase
MAGEDFTFFLDHRPGAFVWIGNGELREGAELHGPMYDFNDAILPAASHWMAEVAKVALARN